MKNGAKIAIVALLAVAVAATFALRGGKRARGIAGTGGNTGARSQGGFNAHLGDDSRAAGGDRFCSYVHWHWRSLCPEA